MAENEKNINDIGVDDIENNTDKTDTTETVDITKTSDNPDTVDDTTETTGTEETTDIAETTGTAEVTDVAETTDTSATKPLPWQKHLFEGLDPDGEDDLQNNRDINMSDDEYSWSQDLYAALSKYRKKNDAAVNSENEPPKPFKEVDESETEVAGKADETNFSESSESAETSGSAEIADSSEITDGAETSNSADTMDGFEITDGAETSNSADTIDGNEATDNDETRDNAVITDNADILSSAGHDADESAKPAESAKSAEYTEDSDNSGDSENTDSIGSSDSSEEPESIMTSEYAEISDNTENIENEPSDFFEQLMEIQEGTLEQNKKEKQKTGKSEKNGEKGNNNQESETENNSTRPRRQNELADRIVNVQESARKDRFSGSPEVKRKENPDQTRSPEEVFNESYTILGEIGSGEGTAYKAMDRRTTRQVVIKKVHMQIQNLQEIKPLVEKLKLLDHPSLPKVLDYVMYNGYVYSVMEYIEGRSLYRTMSDGTRFSEKQIKNWAIQIADALKALHQASPRVIHGDIKPSNIILTSNDRVYLVDFNIGISEENGAHSIGYSDGYAPPEQYDFVSANQYSATGRYDDRFAKTILKNPDGIYTVQSGFTYDASSRAYAIIDEKSDIYSFGATFYYILTGKMPGSSADKVTSISDSGVHISRKFRKIITRCMERSPKKRFQSARALLDVLKKKMITIPMVAAAAAIVILVVCGVLFGSKLFEKKKSKPEMRPPENVLADNSSEGENEITVTPEVTEAVAPTEEVTPEPTKEVTPEPTEEVTPEPTEEVTPEPTEEVTPEPTEEVTPEPTEEVTPEPTEEVTSVPTEEVTPVPTEEVTPVPTEEVTPVPTEEITPIPTEEITPVPTEELTPMPTEEITPVPTEEVTPIPTEEVTPAPTAPLSVIYVENEVGIIYNDGSYKNKKISDLSQTDAETAEYVYLGGYPTKRVTDSDTLAKLEKTSFKSEGTAKLNGVRYNKVNYKNADGSTKTLYYINEAIKWKVLSVENGVLTLITEKIIDFEPIKKESLSTTWSDSKLYRWLNSNFINTTFSDREKKMIMGEPDMLMESELTSAKLSLTSLCTDYARMGFNFGKAYYDAFAAAEWWLKPGSDEEFSEYSYVASDGSISGSKVEDADLKGVRPVIRIEF